MEPDPDELADYLDTGHICASCEEALFTTDEAVLIQVVYPNHVGDRIECYQIDDGQGSYEYEPFFLHLECWEDLLEELNELLEDVPPIVDSLSIFECSVCKSGIRAWETSCLVSPGELRRSPRCPEGEHPIYFDPCLGNPMLLCASCTARFNEEIFEMWETFSHNGECDEGVHKRCWRIGSCDHGECVCPDVEVEDGEEEGREGGAGLHCSSV